MKWMMADGSSDSRQSHCEDGGDAIRNATCPMFRKT